MTTTLRKTGEWVRKDEDRQIATGVLLVPNRIDTQGDFFRPDTIEREAHAYLRRLQQGEATQRLMHAVDAGQKVSLIESRVLDEAEEIGSEQYSAGTWVVSVKVHDSRLWSLFRDGTISGFSIGGDEVEGETLSPEETPDDLTRSAEWPDDAPVQRIDSVRIFEFSPVDQPAVQPATVQVLKATEKDHVDELAAGGQACIEALVERGHSEADAERLCEVMHSDTVKTEDTSPSIGKPFSAPNGATFEDFGDCVSTISGEGTSRAEAEAVCGSWQAESKLEGDAECKVEVNGTTVDLTPPGFMRNAAQLALSKKQEFADDIGGCGSGRGEQRAEQIVSGDLGPEDFLSRDNGTPIPAYLASHADDVADVEGTPPEWSDEVWTSRCGPVQYALWGGLGTGTAAEWAQHRANDLIRAQADETVPDEDLPYPEVASMSDSNEYNPDTNTVAANLKAEYSTGTWTVWPRLGGDSRGQVVDVIEEPGEGFDDAISGDVTVEAEEDNPVYLLEVWDGFGEEASPREDERGRGDTMHVANREDRLREVSDPREREAASSDGVAERIRAAVARFAPGDGGGGGDNQADDSGNSGEDTGAGVTSDHNTGPTKAADIPIETAIAKVGRTLSEDNVAEAKAVHDAAQMMLSRESVPVHSKTAATYTEDEEDDFSLAEHHKSAELTQMLDKIGIPMPEDAFLLYPNAGQAEAVAGDLGLAEESHAHTIEGVGELYMPGRSMALYREAVEQHGADTGGPGGSGAEQGGHNDEEEATEMSADNSEAGDAGGEGTPEGPATEDVAAAMTDLTETVESMADRVEELETELSRVKRGQADSDQLNGQGAGGSGEEPDEVEQFRRSLVPE